VWIIEAYIDSLSNMCRLLQEHGVLSPDLADIDRNILVDTRRIKLVNAKLCHPTTFKVLRDMRFAPRTAFCAEKMQFIIGM